MLRPNFFWLGTLLRLASLSLMWMALGRQLQVLLEQGEFVEIFMETGSLGLLLIEEKAKFLRKKLGGSSLVCNWPWEKGIRDLIIEMDSAVAVNLCLQPSLLGLHPLAALVDSLCELMRKIGDCTLTHAYREKNGVADCFARWSYNLDKIYTT
ncbi:unnamed protein product [Prunus armeniaca]